jgi:hypothetical protein
MSNMPYCQFENTSWDLSSCINAIDYEELTDEREIRYADELRRLCEKYIESYDNSKYNTE